MRVLMISLDKTLLGADYSGDVLERHQEYAQRAGHLDIIVFQKGTFPWNQGNVPLQIHSTNSLSKIFYVWDAYKVAADKGTVLASQGQSPYQLIITQDPFLTGLVGYLLKRKFKIPLLIHFHGDFWQNKYWLKERWFNLILLWLSKFLVKKADGIRVVSSGIKTKLIEIGLAKNKIRVIPTPVNLAKFENYSPEKVEEIRQRYQHKKIILFVGRLSKEKNLPLLFKSAKQLIKEYSDVIFLIIGQGPERKKLELQVTNAKMQDYVKFLGTIKQNELINYYQACYLVVLPSFSESFGKVLLEAGMAEKPAIATMTTGAKEIIIDNQTGFLVPINDEQILAERIIKLLQDESLAQQMGQAAKEHIQARFNPEQIIQKMINFWKDLL